VLPRTVSSNIFQKHPGHLISISQYPHFSCGCLVLCRPVSATNILPLSPGRVHRGSRVVVNQLFPSHNCFFFSQCPVLQQPATTIMPLDAASRTLSPLPDVLSHGLIAVSTFGLLSFVCSTSLFLYLTFRLISWRRESVVKPPINQALFLIYNLLLAGKHS
jgi:hypothetical protein